LGCGERPGKPQVRSSGRGGEVGNITINVDSKRRLGAFDEEANRYDQWFDSLKGKAIFEIERDCLRALVQPVSGLWLEVGVGGGRFAMAFGVTDGIDPSSEMLAIAAQRNINTVRGTGEDLPYRAGIFNGVLMVTTVCFLADPRRAISECRRVLRRTGILILGIVPAESDWGRLYSIRGAKGHPLYSNATFYKCAQVIQICTDAGFVLARAISSLFTLPGEDPVTGLADGTNESAGFVAMRFRR
jgi:ubiquinone/menaquinone biosynthesis C-methylase UbiE